MVYMPAAVSLPSQFARRMDEASPAARARPRTIITSGSNVRFYRSLQERLGCGDDEVRCCLVDPYKKTVTTVVLDEWDDSYKKTWRSGAGDEVCMLLPRPSTEQLDAMLCRREMTRMTGGTDESLSSRSKVLSFPTAGRYGVDTLACWFPWIADSVRDRRHNPTVATDCPGLHSQPGFSLSLNGRSDGTVYRGRALIYKMTAIYRNLPTRVAAIADNFSMVRNMSPDDIDVTWVKAEKKGALPCVVCGAETTLRCAGCLMARYCGAACGSRCDHSE